MIRISYLLLSVVLAWQFFIADAEAAVDSDIMPQVANVMSSPGRCELKSGQKKCRMQLNLIWEAPSKAKYCLFVRGEDAPLKCWQDAWRGSVEIEFQSSKKQYFELKNSHSDAVLAKTGVSVTGSYKQRKRAQRRKRGIWRMF